jgi:nitric oxide reductase subunit B
MGVFLKTVYTWKSELSDIQKYQSFFPYQFLIAANFWVFVNLIQALFMSIPAVNLYTHGTHITVAHAMGTTIGINSMFILAATFYFYGPSYHQKTTALTIFFWTMQLGILLLWLGLIVSGLMKGIWQMAEFRSDFASMMLQLRPWIMLFYLGGLLATIGFGGIGYKLLFGSNRNQKN